MAEDGAADYDDDYLEWFYVEDDFPLADELAETQIPSPGYYGTRGELDDEEYEFDLFDYWMDLSYGDDEYWDEEGARVSTKGVKRKRDGPSKSLPRHNGKRRKVEATEDSPITFRSMAERTRPASLPPISRPNGGSFALLPDWRRRFARESGKVIEKSMPVEMKQAAEGQELVTPQKRMAEVVIDMEEKDAELGEGEHDEDGDEDDMQAQLASLDPEVLKTILKQKLGDAGLDDMDEEALLQTLSKMMSGEEGAEDALTDRLLSKAAEGEDTALSGWLSQQGVALDDDDAGDDVENPSMPMGQRGSNGSHTTSIDVRDSPRDSAIGSSQNAVADQALSPSTPSSSKKRAAISEGSGSAKKRRADLVHPLVNGSVPNHDKFDLDGDSIQVASSKGKDSDTIAVAGMTAPNAEARWSNNTGAAKAAVTEPESTSVAQDLQNEIEVSSQPAHQSRKRKADSEIADEGLSRGKQGQKQAKKTNTETDGSATPIGRRTRSAKARRGN